MTRVPTGFRWAVTGVAAAAVLVAAVAPAPAAPRARGTAVPRSIKVATPRHAAPRYAHPGKRGKGRVPARWLGRPSVLPVFQSRRGWVHVRLPRRPNGSTTWLRTKDVRIGRTPYRIVIDLSATHLKLYRDGRRVMSAAAGVGTPGDPTPRGKFFVAFKQPPPRPNHGYGPFILVTSAHSPRIGNWEGSGDAVIGIHGPLGMNRRIGGKGARISHGCVRLHTKSLKRLKNVPPGTPVNVVR